MDFDFVDWELFREQKLWLIAQQGDQAQGIINMMDSIQDAAFATGRYTEEQIYGQLDKESNGNS
jgi:hypothetical protein